MRANPPIGEDSVLFVEEGFDLSRRAFGHSKAMKTARTCGAGWQPATDWQSAWPAPAIRRTLQTCPKNKICGTD